MSDDIRSADIGSSDIRCDDIRSDDNRDRLPLNSSQGSQDPCHPERGLCSGKAGAQPQSKDPCNLPHADDITRRQWLLRLGEVVALAGISGLVPDSIAAQLEDKQPDAATLPPGLYTPSSDHLVHMLQIGGKQISIPGSETEFAQTIIGTFHPQFFTPEEFRIISRIVEIVLGQADLGALAESAQWLDLWLHSSAGVRDAALHLDPLHRALAVAYYGEDSVRAMETSNPQQSVRAGLAALHDLTTQKYGKGFSELTPQQQKEVVASFGATKGEGSLHKFFDTVRSQAIRGYYTSADGLKDLDYKGNAYYPECPGCPADETKP